MMSHHFLLPKTITKTIQLFSELKKQKKIKSKFLGGKMCPFLCYFSNGWTWKFKNYQKMICLPPSLNNSTPNQTYLTTELWNGFFRKNYKSWLSASKPHFRISSHMSHKKTIFKIRNFLLYDVAPFFAS